MYAKSKHENELFYTRYSVRPDLNMHYLFKKKPG